MKLWCYNEWDRELIECEVEEKLKTYKFISKPVGFTTLIRKENVENFTDGFAYSKSKNDLIKLIKDKFDNDILDYKEKIKKLEELKSKLQ